VFKGFSSQRGKSGKPAEQTGRKDDTRKGAGGKRKGLLSRKPKVEDMPSLSPEAVAAGVSRALRSPKIKPTSAENEIRDFAAARKGLRAIETVLFVLDQVRDVLGQCREIVASAKDTEDLGARALLAEKFDEHRLSINGIVGEVNETGQLLVGPDAEPLEIQMTGRALYSISCLRLDVSDQGLGLSPPIEAFAEDSEVDAILSELESAVGRVERATASYCRDAKFLMGRLKSAQSEKAPEAEPGKLRRTPAVA